MNVTLWRTGQFFSATLIMLAIAGLASPGEPTTLKLVQTIPLKGKAGRLDHLTIDAKQQRLFIANLSNDSLDIVSLKTGKFVTQIAGQTKIQGVAYAGPVDRIFIGNGVDGVCNVFSGKDYKLLKSIKLPDADNVRFDETKGLIYVGHEESISAIDARTYEVKATIKLPGPLEAFQIDAKHGRIYVNSHMPAQVAVIEAARNEVVAKHPLKLASANFPMALDAKNERVFIGCRMPAKLVVMDAKSGKELAGIDIPADIDDLFFDAKRKRLYASCGSGYLAVIQQKEGDRFEIVEKIAVPKLTRTCLFDTASDRLFVPIPRQSGDVGPTLRIYQPKD